MHARSAAILYMSDVLSPAVCDAQTRDVQSGLHANCLWGSSLRVTLPMRPPMVRRWCICLHFNKACHYLLACDVPLTAPLKHKRCNNIQGVSEGMWFMMLTVLDALSGVSGKCDSALFRVIFCCCLWDALRLELFPCSVWPCWFFRQAEDSGVTHHWK